MKNYSGRIRDWLKANPGAHTPQVILDSMGVAAGAKLRRPYYSAMKECTDAGYLERTGTGRRTSYTYVSEPAPRPVGRSKASTEKHRERMRQVYADKGGRTLAQRRIDEALQKAARLERLQLEKAERAAARLVRRDKIEAERRARAVAIERKVTATAQAVIAVRRAPPRRAESQPAPSVEEFLRNGGQVIRLPGVEQYIRDRRSA
ncbi:hypothetical protein JH314_08220 [Xanthomonas campestris]|uniref:hypothetical protein n=1 Tax=Xanthomonas campestris TaxID=339 RepID=UPI0023684FB0|nr:hypothetical protein [Xanthomonas campestris]WDJ03375.1 hypothetical protein JH314_08220 [Xanthomonas campestris]